MESGVKDCPNLADKIRRLEFIGWFIVGHYGSQGIVGRIIDRIVDGIISGAFYDWYVFIYIGYMAYWR